MIFWTKKTQKDILWLICWFTFPIYIGRPNFQVEEVCMKWWTGSIKLKWLNLSQVFWGREPSFHYFCQNTLHFLLPPSALSISYKSLDKTVEPWLELGIEQNADLCWFLNNVRTQNLIFFIFLYFFIHVLNYLYALL